MTASNSPDPVPPSPQRQQRNTPSPSPRPAGSLQATATVNAGLQHEPSRRSPSSGGGPPARNIHSPGHHGRRRSSVLMNLQLNDPSIPAPGEMITDNSGPGSGLTASPQPRSPILLGRDPLNHGRAPSLGEIHQEFEAETEAHVNRLLHIIQQQQLQLRQLQQTQSGSQGQSPAANGDETASATQGGVSSAPSSALPTLTPSSSSLPRSPIHPRSSFDLARADLQRRSRTPSRGASPRLRSASISGESGDPLVLGGRDESAFYQAETQMLTRENQMLRHRVRELERQLQELANCSSAVTHEPFNHSHLTCSTSVSEDEPTATPHSTETARAGGTRNQSQQQPTSQPLPAPADVSKEK